MTPRQAERYFRRFVSGWLGDYEPYYCIKLPNGTSLEDKDIAALRRKFDAAIAKG